MQKVSIRIRYFTLGALVLATAFSGNALAGSFLDSSFEEATSASETAGKKGNVHGAKEAENLDTADTVKATADYVGMAATTATIGTEIYDWMGTDSKKKLDALEKQYKSAIANGNGQLAEAVLRQINEIKAGRQTVAKDQASTQSSLGTIQTVAGIGNLGAAAGSFYAGYVGYSSASTLKSGCAVPQKIAKDASGNIINRPLTADEIKQVAPIWKKQEEEYKICMDHTEKASKAAKKAGTTSIIYGAGEAAVGVGSLMLASKHKQNANDLQSLADDPDAGLDPTTSGELALYDRAAQEKCGSGTPYELLPPGSVANSTTSSSSGSNVRTSTGGAGAATGNQVTYAETFNRINCLPIIPDGDGTGGGTNTNPNVVTNPNNTVTCVADALLCPDGSYVTRDPARSCEFNACPSAGRAIALNVPAPIPTATSPSSSPASDTPTTARSATDTTLLGGTPSTAAIQTDPNLAAKTIGNISGGSSGASRAPASNLSGASRAPMDDLGAEMERENKKNSKNHF